MFFGSMTAVITPFEADGEKIDFLSFKQIVERQIGEGSDGIVIAGSTGEGSTLTPYEIEELIDYALSIAKGRVPIIVGTGTNATKKSVELVRIAKNFGVSGALVTVPYYNRPTPEGVILHFKHIASVGLSIIAYHHPGRTGVSLDATSLATISKIDHIVGIKDCSGNVNLTKEVMDINSDATMLCGNDDITIEMIRMGAKGSISVLGNLFPDLWRKMVHASLKKNFLEAENLLEEVRTLLWALDLDVNPQGIKCAMAKEGYCNEVLRLPMVPVNPGVRKEIHSAVNDLLQVV